MDFSQELRAYLVGRRLQIARREADWVLTFDDDLQVCVCGYWRLRDKTGILVTDQDDGHRFGLPTPVDAQAKVNEILGDAIVSETEFNHYTGDLTIYAGSGLVFEILTFSMGYESWQMYSSGGFEAAVGNGGVR